MKLVPWNITIKVIILTVFVVTVLVQSQATFGMLDDGEKELQDNKTKLQELKSKINKELQSIDYDEYYIFAARELKSRWMEDLKTCKLEYISDETSEVKENLLHCEITKSEYWNNLVQKLQNTNNKSEDNLE